MLQSRASRRLMKHPPDLKSWALLIVRMSFLWCISQPLRRIGESLVDFWRAGQASLEIEERGAVPLLRILTVTRRAPAEAAATGVKGPRVPGWDLWRGFCWARCADAWPDLARIATGGSAGERARASASDGGRGGPWLEDSRREEWKGE